MRQRSNQASQEAKDGPPRCATLAEAPIGRKLSTIWVPNPKNRYLRRRKVRLVSRARQRLDGSLSFSIGVNALEFLDFSDGDGSSSLSLEHSTGALHILSDKGHHLLTLVGIGHVRRDWEIDESVLGEDDDR